MQNRIRAIVAVVMLLGAFMIFVPRQGGEVASEKTAKNEATVENKVPDELDKDLAWHGGNDERLQNQQEEARSDIKPLFFADSVNPEIPRANQAIRPSQIQNQYRPLLPFELNQPLKVADSDLIPIESKPFAAVYEEPAADTITHQIQFGETLQGISTRYFGSPNEYLKIYEFNIEVLDEPINLPAGVKILIPRGGQ